jgi:hypothetical protein
MVGFRGKHNHKDNLIISIFLSIFFFLAMWAGVGPTRKDGMGAG